MNVKTELQKNQTMLVLMPSLEYNKDILDIIRGLAGASICYVTLNKTADSLRELFKKSKVNVNNIIFIDAISKTLKSEPYQTNYCYYVSSPAALEELSLTMGKFLKHEFQYLIFDSLTNLMIYQKRDAVIKFISSIVNKIRASKTKAVFYALNIKEQSELIKESSMFVDKVIQL